MATATTQQTSLDGQFSDELRVGATLLQGQYIIERFLNSGGFGMTYLAKNSLNRIVVVKECFPASFCARSNNRVHARSRTQEKEFKTIVKLFVQEAQRLAKLDHPNIVGVHQVFEDNDTAYMVLDFIDGTDLFDIIESDQRYFSPDEITKMLLKILDAVGYMHDQNVLHRDISPDNIIINKSGDPVLIDFGAAREQATKASRALSAMLVVKDGYSPQEFYLAGSHQSPSSDLYALAATFYHFVAGEAPPNSQNRLAAVAANREDPYKSVSVYAKGFEPNFLDAIDIALKLFPKERLQSAQDWAAEIDTDRRRSKIMADALQDKKIEISISKLVTETNRNVAEDLKNAEIVELELELETEPEPDLVKTPHPLSSPEFLNPQEDLNSDVEEAELSDAVAEDVGVVELINELEEQETEEVTYVTKPVATETPRGILPPLKFWRLSGMLANHLRKAGQ